MIALPSASEMDLAAILGDSRYVYCFDIPVSFEVSQISSFRQQRILEGGFKTRPETVRRDTGLYSVDKKLTDRISVGPIGTVVKRRRMNCGVCYPDN